MRARQLSFLDKQSLVHGGDLRKGRRKEARPIDNKRPMHVTLRSTRARGEWSMLHPRHRPHVEARARQIAAKWDVRIYRFANVGNHLHMVIQARKRPGFQSFLRELGGTIAVMITGARKGNPIGRFWDRLAWSRVLHWGRDFKGAMKYLIKNIFEAEGLLTRSQIKAGYQVISLEFDPPPE